jgi:acetyl esterase/lipase
MAHRLLRNARRLLIALALGCMIPASGAALGAEPGRPKAETFFSNSLFSDAKLSPDGDFIAMLVGSDGGRMKLLVMDLADMSIKVASGAESMDIAEVHWVNDQRLVFSTNDRQAADGDVRYWPGLFAINRDGSELKVLANRSPEAFFTTESSIHRTMLPGNTFFFDSDHSGESDDIFVAQTVYTNSRELRAVNLLRLNTKSGHAKPFERSGDTVGWLIDQAGVPRLNVTLHDGISEIFYLDPVLGKWRKLAGFNAYDGSGFQPYAFGPDGTLYVLAAKGRDTNALYRYDFDKNTVAPEPLIAMAGYDFNGELLFDSERKTLAGIQYRTDADATLWFDGNMKKIQKTIDDLLPSTINTLSIARHRHSKNILVRARSDVQPATYLLYDDNTGKLVVLGSAHPDVDSKQMSHQDMVHYKARDGLEIPAYLTLPRGGAQKDLPLVVLVHGGPWVRGSTWGWDSEVQFLASRGYAVLQPEYRGSTGFGFKHFKAGWKQWGLSMQDDIADGARWAISQGIADPKRICIAGASYGGYATLMGLDKDADLFRCGIEWAGVTDIMRQFEWDPESDSPEQWQRYGMPVLVGDKVKDAEQLKATSPVNVAQGITQPVLIAHGGADRRVPIVHARKFLEAVRPHNDKIEWVEYPEEGHGWRLVKNRLDFWTRVEKFLGANIGKPQ